MLAGHYRATRACSRRTWLLPKTAERLSCVYASSMVRKIIKGIIFDMDGTCTEPVIDFKEMRRRAGILEGDILAALESLSPPKRQKALQAIEEVEHEALPRMRLMPGLNDLCSWLDTQKIPRGIITRNGQVSVDHFHSQHFTAQAFNPALCRDFKPYKPSPAGILHICKEWGISPAECMMVGDSAKDDVVSGNRAGAVSVLLDITGEHNSHEKGLDADLQPGLTVSSMAQLQKILASDFHLQPSA